MRPQQPPGKPNPWVEGETAAYHITHIENLASILSCGQMDCDTRCAEAEHATVGIAHSGLKAQRAKTEVDVAAGGTLADYVPFYYAPRSPMLAAIFYENVPEYRGSQEEIVHLVCSVDQLAEPGRFVIVDRHPINPLAEQFDDLAALDDLDWPLMSAKYWRDTDEDGDRKYRRQAEFLVHRHVAIESVLLVGAMTRRITDQASRLLAGLVDPPPVIVRRDWYY